MTMNKILHHHLPSPPIKEDHLSPTKQGILTILSEKTKSSSIRRTLSADMSSMKWLQQNEFCPHTEEVLPDHDDIWKSIQAKKNEKTDTNVWASLILNKSGNSISTLPLPYIHPLVKNSASTLSKKSLEICTESLGSETGSGCFSSYPASEVIDEDKEDRVREEEIVKESNHVDDFHVAKYKVLPVRPFPPPISSISGGDEVHMHSHRKNGRLVLEVVSIPPRDYFQTCREGGRLVLTLVNSQNEDEDESKDEVFDNMEEVDENMDEEKKKMSCEYWDSGEDEGTESENVVKDYGGDGRLILTLVNNQNEMLDGNKDEVFENIEHEKKIGYGYMPKDDENEAKNVVKEDFYQKSRSRVISVNKTGLVMKKLMASTNMNPTWSNKFKMMDADVEDGELMVPHSLPPQPRVPSLVPASLPATTASFNAYDYFWRNKNIGSGGFINPMITTAHSTPLRNKINYQELVVKGDKTEDLAPYLRACKDGRRTLLIWETYCIATT